MYNLWPCASVSMKELFNYIPIHEIKKSAVFHHIITDVSPLFLIIRLIFT